MRALLRWVRTSATLASLTDKLLASLAHHSVHWQTGNIFPALALLTHSALLGDTACAESHNQTGTICLSLVLLAHSALLGDTVCAESHTQTGAFCSLLAHSALLVLLIILNNWGNLTIQESIGQICPQAAEKKHLLQCRSAPWWPISAPPGGKVAMNYPNHPLKYQANQPTNSWAIGRDTVTKRLCTRV